MSQTNTNNNNDQNQNYISRRGGWGQGPGGRDCGNCSNDRKNSLIKHKYSFKGKMKDGPIFKINNN